MPEIAIDNKEYAAALQAHYRAKYEGCELCEGHGDTVKCELNNSCAGCQVETDDCLDLIPCPTCLKWRELEKKYIIHEYKETGEYKDGAYSRLYMYKCACGTGVWVNKQKEIVTHPNCIDPTFTLPEVIDAIKETGDYEGFMLDLREKCNWMFAEPTLERFVNTLHNADLLKEAHMSYLNRNKEG